MQNLVLQIPFLEKLGKHSKNPDEKAMRKLEAREKTREPTQYTILCRSNTPGYKDAAKRRNNKRPARRSGAAEKLGNIESGN